MGKKHITNWRLWHYEQTLKGMEASPKQKHLFLAIEGMKKRIAKEKQRVEIKAVHGK